jgi:hypothetical protein
MFELCRYDQAGGYALYAWSGATGESRVFGLTLISSGKSPLPSVSLQDFWGVQSSPAAAILLAPSEPQGDLALWAAYIGYSAPAPNNVIAWLVAPLTAPPYADQNFLRILVNRQTNQIPLIPGSGFNLGVLQVSISQSSDSLPAAAWDFSTATLTLTNALLNGTRLDDLDNSYSVSTQNSSLITMSLNGDAAGALTYTIPIAGGSRNLDAIHFFALLSQQPASSPSPQGAFELRYFYPKGKLSFPMAKPIGAQNTWIAIKQASLNPALPFSASQTFFQVDVTQKGMAALFTCPNVMQTNGTNTALVPAAGFCFHLAPTPDSFTPAASPANPHPGSWGLFYAAPFGPMTVQATGPIKLMCGLSGLEYLTLQNGDSVNLVPGQNAYAPNFIPPGTTLPGGGAAGGTTAHEFLTGLGQTSWLSVPAPNQTPSAYYAQADAEPFFAAAVAPNASYPSAVASYLSNPSAGGAAPPFPFAAHSGVYDASNSNPDPGETSKSVPATYFTAYESQVLVQHRYKVLVPETAVPVFGDQTGTALSGGGAATPTGFIAALNSAPNKEAALAMESPSATPNAGTWNSLTLALHTENAGLGGETPYTLAFLASDQTGMVSPLLIQGLLHSKVFLVANNWDPAGPLGKMESEMVVDGFAFHVKPVSTTDAYDTIAVFKFQTTAALKGLVETPNVWFRPDSFVSTQGSGVPGVQRAIREAIQVAENAKGSPTDPYGYFRDTIASDPNWTGVVFFHVPIDGGNMPPDLQILFAGIDGQLYAHHFGIDLNHLKNDRTHGPQLQDSSLFGVIHYQGTLPPPNPPQPTPGWDKFGFTLLDLTVELENSVVTAFDAFVAMTIPELFDRQVSFLDPDFEKLAPPSTLVTGGIITAISVANQTVITSAAHGLSTGATIVITESDSTPPLDGPQTITVLTPDTFTVPVAVTIAGTTGIWVQRITNISASTVTAPQLSVVTSPAHGLSTGETIRITGSDSIPRIDGRRVVGVLTPDTFTVQVAVTTAGTTAKWIVYPVDTLVIKGVYQQQGNGPGSVGTVSFQRTDPLAIPTLKDPVFNRVVDQFLVNTAALTPVASQSQITHISAGDSTVVTSPAHGLSSGTTILITGSDSDPSIDGARKVTAPTADTFSFDPPVKVTTEGTKGTWVLLASANKITQISAANPTVVTSPAHGLVDGVPITIAGSNSIPTIDGSQVVKVLTPDTFTVPIAVTTAGTEGAWKADKIQARFSLGGELCFVANPFGIDDPADLFSFGTTRDGTVAGLDLENLGLNILFYFDQDGARVGDTTIVADYSHIQVSQSQDGIRDKSLLKSFPMKITTFAHDPNGLTPSNLAASPMNVVNLKGHDAVTPTFALECDLPLGSMGFLAGAHADISSKLVLGWGPSSATPDTDAAQVMVRLFNLSADVEGFSLEGILQVGFKDANLICVPQTPGSTDDVYVALFNNVALKILGISFPPNVLANFLLMAGTDDPANQSIAWYLAAAQKCNTNGS